MSPPRSAGTGPTPVRVAVIGAGFGGLGAAIRLRQRGLDDFVVLERAPALGGTWRDNRYPGAACDVPSHLYSFSFAPNPRWSRWYSPQPEIRAYLERCAVSFGVLPRIRFGHDVQRIDWDEAARRWYVRTSGGDYVAQFVVAAPGPLAEPRLPDLPGLDAFAGPMFHTARWPEGLDLAGQRVAVIGTGASVIQVVPAIQPLVAGLVVFQRTPPWVIPRHDFALRPRLQRWLDRVPPLQRLVRGGLYFSHEIAGLPFRHPRLARLGERIARFHLRRQVRDPALRRALTPDYLIGCKRVLLSDDWYPALQRPNVTLVTGGATAITARGVIGADGVEHAVDAIVLGTGFEVTEVRFAERVHGRGGRPLADDWRPSPRAHLGTTVAVADVDRRMRRTVWLAGGCRSWYLDSTGRNAATWPGSVGAFRRRVAAFREAEYRLQGRAP